MKIIKDGPKAREDNRMNTKQRKALQKTKEQIETFHEIVSETTTELEGVTEILWQATVDNPEWFYPKLITVFISGNGGIYAFRPSKKDGSPVKEKGLAKAFQYSTQMSRNSRLFKSQKGEAK